ncbi:MAG: glycogen synthase GlgA [Ignavibacteria bacterium]|nr:glycogen synthase GlgA [Ignavibacteria bacterium]
MNVAFLTTECFPYVKTGGLADVSGSLPKALQKLGCDMKVFLPLYDTIKTIDNGLYVNEEFKDIPVQVGDNTFTFNFWEGTLPDSDVTVYFIDCPHYFHRGKPYTDDKDEDERFIFFQIACLETMQRLKWSPAIINCNDWQTGLIPSYIKFNYNWDELFKNTRTILSIHNIGYQGRFAPSTLQKAGLNYDNFYPEGPYELDGAFSFLKAGIWFADLLTTVSPNYAKEIQTEEYGAGLEGVLQMRSKDLYGILNGIDVDIWNPEKDIYIPYNYSADKVDAKYKIKKHLIKEAGFKYDENIPVIGLITRLTGQKGLDLIMPVFHELMQLPIYMMVLGSGEKKYEEFIERAADAYTDKFIEYVGYNNELSHLITAASDMFLMPSLYEPCGLNQMYSLRYGTVPIVRKTGGLADTVHDYHEHNNEGNGFSFEDAQPHVLLETVKRALSVYQDKKEWKKIMLRGMKEDFSWEHSAKEYFELFEKIDS